MAANADFVCYSIKSSIRVIHRSTGARALIKLAGQVASGTPQVRQCLNDVDVDIRIAMYYTGECTSSRRTGSGISICRDSTDQGFPWEYQAGVEG